MSDLQTFAATYPRELAIVVALTAASLTRPGRWTWRHWWWPLMCAAGRAVLPDATAYRREGRTDRRRWFTDIEKAAALRRDGPRCQCPRGTGDDGCRAATHHHGGQCEVIHLDGQKLVGGHRKAHARGGRTNLANLVMLCAACNSGWSDRTVPALPRRRRWWHRHPAAEWHDGATERTWT